MLGRRVSGLDRMIVEKINETISLAPSTLESPIRSLTVTIHIYIFVMHYIVPLDSLC